MPFSDFLVVSSWRMQASFWWHCWLAWQLQWRHLFCENLLLIGSAKLMLLTNFRDMLLIHSFAQDGILFSVNFDAVEDTMLALVMQIGKESLLSLCPLVPVLLLSSLVSKPKAEESPSLNSTFNWCSQECEKITNWIYVIILSQKMLRFCIDFRQPKKGSSGRDIKLLYCRVLMILF